MPLSDVRVVDYGQAIAGPICGTYLADLGPDVVKVERPGGDVYRTDRRELDGKPFNPAFEQYNRNKRSLWIDMTTDEGLQAIHDLVEVADVFVQNWPPGVAASLEVDYETLSDLNDDLIYVHVTGYGETGPMADRPAMDTIVQHLSGLSNLLGYDDDKPPIRTQSSIADLYAGCHAAISALGALYHRDANDAGGQQIDVSLLESLMHNIDGAFEYYHNLGEVPSHAGRNGFFTPDMLYGAAEAKDGYVCVALLLYSDRIWEAACELMGREDLLGAERYRTDAGRVADAGHLSSLFEDWLRDLPAEEAVETLNEAGIPAAHHNDLAEAADMDQVAARDVFQEIDHPRLGTLTVTTSPLDLSDTPVREPGHTPVLGEHNREILAELGYGDEQIEAFLEGGVLAARTGWEA